MAALFEAGLDMARLFYAAVETGPISDEDENRHVPIYVNLLSAGPSVDFILGRVFQFTLDEAHDNETT